MVLLSWKNTNSIYEGIGRMNEAQMRKDPLYQMHEMKIKHSKEHLQIQKIPLEIKEIFLAESDPKTSPSIVYFSKSLDSKKVRNISHSMQCSGGIGSKLSNKFLVEYNRDMSNCPREDWLLAMAETDPFNDKVFVNVGANKGYNLAVWLNNFKPRLSITPMKWHEALMNVNTRRIVDCGVCKDCEATFTISPEANPTLYSSQSHLTMFAVDLNCENIQLIQQIPSILTTLDGTYTSIYTSCAGVSDVASRITMTKCPIGHERCHLSHDTTNSIHITGKVSLPIVTLTELIRIFHEKLQHKQGSHHHHHLHDHSLTPTTTDTEYKPFIDILMIDTEGNDYLVLKGAHELFQYHQIRVVIFEYHQLLPWKDQLLEECIKEMEYFGFDCYFQGQGRLWKISGEDCWQSNYEFHDWSNVMCVYKQDIWYETIQSFVMKV